MHSSKVKHPLARGLGDDWRWFHDPTVHTWTMVHESGLHIEMPCDILWNREGEASGLLEWSGLAHCMAEAVRDDETGLRFVLPLQVDSGPSIFELVKPAEDQLVATWTRERGYA
ncbi:MAG: hypothetical protein V3R87_12950 [Dehalococcoidia bacterium]